jgi:hypothetical protein
MRLQPDEIKNHISEIGKKEAFRLLKEWIGNSDDRALRERALQILAHIDDGSNYDFFESLFLSEEDLKISILSGRILGENYANSDDIISLLSYILYNIKPIQKKLLAIDILKHFNTKKANSILLKYFKKVIQTQIDSNFLMKHLVESQPFSKGQLADIVEIGTNLLLFHSFREDYGYSLHLRDGLITSLTCEKTSFAKITEIPGIQKLTHLKELNLKHNNITKINNISFLKHLELLNLSFNSITQIKNLNSCKNLKELRLSHNEIEEINHLEGLTNLKSLYLGHNKIKRIENLDNLQNLEFLSLRNNAITAIKGVKSISNLRYLDLSNNQIKGLKGLHPLQHLHSLHLANNKIESAEEIDSLSNLKELYLDNNQICELKPLNSIHHLFILSLINNKIVNLSNKTREFLKRINFVYLNQNPLDSSSRKWYFKKISGI